MEKLNLWDRFFNRYKKIIHKRGSETWIKIPTQQKYVRNYVDYMIIDRISGSETIEREYLN